MVTALHGIVGCREVRVATESGPPLRRSVALSKVYLDGDAALLTSTELDSLYTGGLTIAQHTPAPLERLTVQGHPFGIAKLATTIEVRNPVTAVLADLLPAEIADKVGDRNSPSTQLRVLSIQGHLLPGHSGAPVIDSSGAVVGMAGGGLAGGGVEISWAIPMSEIRWSNPIATTRMSRLMTSDPSVLFAFEKVEGTKDAAPATAPLELTASAASFSFRYPRDWGVLAEELDQKIVFLRSGLRTLPNGGTWRNVFMEIMYYNIVRMRQEWGPELAAQVASNREAVLDMFRSVVTSEMEKYPDTAKSHDSGIVETPYGLGMWLDFLSSTSFGYNQRTRVLLARRPDGSVFQANLVAPVDQFEHHAETFDQILESVTFRASPAEPTSRFNGKSSLDSPPLEPRRPTILGEWELRRYQNGGIEVTQLQFRQGRSAEEGTFDFAAGGAQPGRFQGTWRLDAQGNLALGFGPEPLRLQPDGSFRGTDGRGSTLVLVRR